MPSDTRWVSKQGMEMAQSRHRGSVACSHSFVMASLLFIWFLKLRRWPRATLIVSCPLRRALIFRKKGKFSWKVLCHSLRSYQVNEIVKSLGSLSLSWFNFMAVKTLANREWGNVSRKTLRNMDSQYPNLQVFICAPKTLNNFMFKMM